MVIGIDDQNQIDRLGKIRTAGTRQHGDQKAQMFALRAFPEETQHVRLDVNCEQFPFWDEPGDARAEITRPGAKIGHTCGSVEMQCIQDLVRLLPRVTGGIIEFFCPLLGLVERAVVPPIRVTAAVMIAFERVIARRFRGRLRERSDGCCSSKYKQQGKQPH